MFFTREPRMPTQAPTGSTFRLSLEDGDLGPIAGFARNAADLDCAVGDFAHFEFEKSPNEIGMAARDDDFRATNAVLDRDDISAQPIADIVVLDHDALALRHDRFEFSEVENHIGAIEAPDRAAHDLARAILEFLVNHFLLDLADALHHRLLRGLGGDAAEIFRRHFHFDGLADLRVWFDSCAPSASEISSCGFVTFSATRRLARARISPVFGSISMCRSRDAPTLFSTPKGARSRPPRAGSRV